MSDEARLIAALDEDDPARAQVMRAESLLKSTGRDANRTRELAQVHATLAIAHALLDLRDYADEFVCRYLKETER